MKIICESQEEYDDLMAASRYIHDLNLFDRGEGAMHVLQHLYLGIEGAPGRADIVWIDENFIKE